MQIRSQKSGTEPAGHSVPGRGRRFLLLVTSLAISACLLGGIASSASALDFGLAAAGSQPTTDYEMEAVSRSGAKDWRFGLDCFSWYGHESTIWQEDWDKKFQLAWEHGITVLPTLSSRCASVAIELPSRSEWEPAGSSWEKFAKAVVEHYGINGSFWSGKSNPKPVENWEIQNEPNLAERGVSGVASGWIYAEFFKRIAETLQAAQGSFFPTHSLVGGLYYGDVNDGASKTPHTFMQEMNNMFPAVKPWVYGVAIHPYEFGTNSNLRIWEDITQARSDVNSYIGTNKPLWITEIGWPVQGHNVDVPAASLSEQAGAVHDLFKWVKQEASGKNIQTLIFYMYRDDALGNGTWAHFCGLRAAQPPERYSESTFRPAWYAFQEEVGAAKWPVAPYAESQAATNVGTTEATLHGIINPHNLPTGYHFEWAEGSEGFSHWLPAHDTEAGWKEGNVSESQTLTGLEPNTTYHYRIVGTNENNEKYFGANLAFTTGQAPVQAHPLAETSGKLDLFWRNNEGELEYMSSTSEGSSWSTPVALGGALSGEPSAVETGTGHLAVFWRNATTGGTFGNLMEKTYNGTSWGTIQNLGMGVLGADPYAVGQSSGTIDVFWRGGDNHLWHAYYVGSAWSTAQNMGGAMASDPSPVQTSPGLIDVFWKGSDAALWHSWYTPETGFWHGPESRGMGPLGRGPKAVGQSNGTVDVFWKGTTWGLFHAYYVPGSWHGPENFGGSVEFDPAPVATGGGNVEVWYKGTNQELWHNWYLAGNNTWNGPGSLGSWPLGSAPQAAALANHNTFVFWTYAPLNGVYMKWYNASSGVWNGPVQVSTVH